MADRRYKSFEEFYPFYLSEHVNPVSRKLHFIGTGLFFLVTLAGIFRQQWSLLLLGPFFGYGFAWVGHFFFEKNKPATFQYPLYSLLGDFRFFFEVLGGKQRL